MLRGMLRWLRPLSTFGPCLLLACGPSATSLADRTFLSVSATEDGAPRALVGTTRLRLHFFDDRRLSASAGCNGLDGRYSIQRGTLVVTDSGTTLIGCDPALHEQDDWYFGFVLSKPAIEVDGDSLVLEGSGIRIEYLDQEVATPDVELTGVTWTVETIIDGELAQHAEWPDPATIEFGTDGTVEVYTGCNGGTGTYRVSDGALTFIDVAVSERGCEGPTGELERVVLGVVHGPQPVAWEITVDRLSLRGQGYGLDLRASGGG
jgi:heat shock protein HslJ